MYTGGRGLERGRRRKKWTSFPLVSSWEGSFGVQSTNLHLAARPFFFCRGRGYREELGVARWTQIVDTIVGFDSKTAGDRGGLFCHMCQGPHIKDKQLPPITPFLSQPAHIFQPDGISLQVAHSNKNTHKYIVY